MRIVSLLVACLVLSGCVILSDGQVTALKNSAVILEGGSKSNAQTAKILAKDPDVDRAIIKIFEQGSKREATVAKTIRSIVGDDEEGEQPDE